MPREIAQGGRGSEGPTQSCTEEAQRYAEGRLGVRMKRELTRLFSRQAAPLDTLRPSPSSSRAAQDGATRDAVFAPSGVSPLAAAHRQAAPLRRAQDGATRDAPPRYAPPRSASSRCSFGKPLVRTLYKLGRDLGRGLRTELLGMPYVAPLHASLPAEAAPRRPNSFDPTQDVAARDAIARRGNRPPRYAPPRSASSRCGFGKPLVRTLDKLGRDLGSGLRTELLGMLSSARPRATASPSTLLRMMVAPT